MSATSPSGAEVYAAQRATCRRKRSYLSRTTAANAAYLLSLVPGVRLVEPYRCPCCNDWHLTTKRGA